jgi:hypothetical protein
MSDAASWPDPERPGVPLNPERDGWHWLGHPGTICMRPFGWDARHQAWHDYGLNTPNALAHFGYYYICPCLTPSEVAAREAAAERRGMERAAEIADGFTCGGCGMDGKAAAAIRAEKDDRDA